MLIRLFSQVCLSFTEYPGQLVIHMNTDNREDCGVFSGRHAGFTSPEEMNQRMPTLPQDSDDIGTGFMKFVITRDPIVSPHPTSRTYPYLITQRESGVYLSYLKSKELILTETTHTDNQATEWYMYFNGSTILLPDYGVKGA